MGRKRAPAHPSKRRYTVAGTMTISVHTTVYADSPEEAKEIALKERSPMSLCYQCSHGEPESEWVTSGELDGEPDVQDVEEEEEA